MTSKPKETIINTVGTGRITTVRLTDGEDHWSVFTERESHKRLFLKLFGAPHRELGQGSEWLVPWDDLKIRGRRTRTVSVEQKQAMAARLSQARAKRLSS